MSTSTMPYRPEIPHDLSRVPQTIRAAIDKCRAGQSPWPLTLIGPAGCGKTRAALCAMDEVTDGPRIMRTATEMAMWLADARRGGYGEERAMWEYIASASLFVLDDIGTRSTSDCAYESVAGVFNLREDRPTIVISNHPLKMIQKLYDDRIVSRIKNGTTPNLDGLPDLRAAGWRCRITGDKSCQHTPMKS